MQVLLYKARRFLNQESLKNTYYAYIHSYLNNTNIARTSTHKTKLKKLFSQQKQATRIIYQKSRTSDARQLVNFCVSQMH